MGARILIGAGVVAWVAALVMLLTANGVFDTGDIEEPSKDYVPALAALGVGGFLVLLGVILLAGERRS